jgi:hypothetical protein
VLRAVPAAPGSTNRQVADAVGLADEGQTSSMLARLHRHRQIENVSVEAARGEPNAWLLRLYGERALRRLARPSPRELRGASVDGSGTGIRRAVIDASFGATSHIFRGTAVESAGD